MCSIFNQDLSTQIQSPSTFNFFFNLSIEDGRTKPGNLEDVLHTLYFLIAISNHHQVFPILCFQIAFSSHFTCHYSTPIYHYFSLGLTQILPLNWLPTLSLTSCIHSQDHYWRNLGKYQAEHSVPHMPHTYTYLCYKSFNSPHELRLKRKPFTGPTGPWYPFQLLLCPQVILSTSVL